MFTKQLQRLPFILCLVLFSIHLFMILRWSLDMPIYDEWYVFQGTALNPEFSWDWIYGFHNEHRMIPTKLLIWIQYKINGWYLPAHQAINFILFGLILITVIQFGRKMVPRFPTWLTALFCAFFLTPLNHENHILAFNTHFHLSILFFLSSVYFIFHPAQRHRTMALGCLSLIAGIFSFGSGVMYAALIAIIYLIFQLLQNNLKKSLSNILILFGVVGSSILIWRHGYKPAYNAPEWIWPNTTLFWSFYSNLIALGFGIDEVSTFTGILASSIVFIFVMLGLTNIGKKPMGRSPEFFAIFTIIAGTLVALAGVSLTRSIFGMGSSKGSRYFENGMLLMPFTAFAAFYLFEKRSKKLQVAILSGLWMFSFIALLNNWRFPVYVDDFFEKQHYWNCSLHFFQDGKGGPSCPKTIEVVAPNLMHAKKINASFYRALQRKNESLKNSSE